MALFSVQTSRLLGLLICLILALNACSASKSDRRDSEVATEKAISDAYKKKQKAFVESNPKTISSIGDLSLTVRLATIADLPEERHKSWLLFPAEGSGSLALGLAAPPMYASGLVVGGIILLPLGTAIYVHDKGVWDSISKALSDAEVTKSIERRMKKHIKQNFAPGNVPNINVELVVKTFGIIEDLNPCFEASVILKVSRSGKGLIDDKMSIAIRGGSEDAPPPQCTTLERFAENEASLVKDMSMEYSEIFSVMATERILRAIEQ